TAPLYLGFFNFVESVPATLLVVALAERELSSPRTGRAVALAVLAAGLLYLHPSALALALGSAVLLAATAGTGWRRALRAIAPFAPAVALLAACLSLPETVGAAGSLPLRTLPLLAFVVLSAPALAPRRATSALLAAAVALQIIYGAKLSAVHRAFDAEAEAPQLEQVLHAAEPG